MSINIFTLNVDCNSLWFCFNFWAASWAVSLWCNFYFVVTSCKYIVICCNVHFTVKLLIWKLWAISVYLNSVFCSLEAFQSCSCYESVTVKFLQFRRVGFWKWADRQGLSNSRFSCKKVHKNVSYAAVAVLCL